MNAQVPTGDHFVFVFVFILVLDLGLRDLKHAI